MFGIDVLKTGFFYLDFTFCDYRGCFHWYPSAPGVGIVILGNILESAGVPITAIVVSIGVERLFGMLRTSVNVMGDLTACSFF